MVSFKTVNDFRLRGGKYFMPCISIDCVIFGFHDGQLKVLLLKIANLGGWGLPAGFIYKEEHIDVSAQRILSERTGLQDWQFLIGVLLAGRHETQKSHNQSKCRA